MSYDDDGFAIFLHIAHYLEKVLGFLRGEDGCGFIKNKNLCSSEKHLYNFHCLFLGNRHIIYFFIGVDLESVFITDCLDLFFCVRKIQFSIKTQHNIFSRIENVYELEMLMNHSYTKGKCISR